MSAVRVLAVASDAILEPGASCVFTARPVVPFHPRRFAAFAAWHPSFLACLFAAFREPPSSFEVRRSHLVWWRIRRFLLGLWERIAARCAHWRRPRLFGVVATRRAAEACTVVGLTLGSRNVLHAPMTFSTFDGAAMALPALTIGEDLRVDILNTSKRRVHVSVTAIGDSLRGL